MRLTVCAKDGGLPKRSPPYGRAVILLAAFLCCFCRVPPSHAGDKVKLVIGTFGFLFIPVFTADATGQFDAAGLSVDIENVKSGTAALAAVIAGSAEFSVQSFMPSFLADEKGAGTLVVGAVITQMASNVVVSKAWADQTRITPDSSLAEKFASLRNARLGIISPGDGTDHVIRYLVKRAGLDPSRDVTIVTLGSNAGMIPALANNAIDGFTSSPPVPDTAISRFGAVRLFNLVGGELAALDGFTYQGVITRQSFATEHPDTVVRLLRGLQRALDMIHDPVRSIGARDRVRQKYFIATDPAVYDQIWHDMEPAFPRTVELSEAQIRQVVDFEREVGGTLTAGASRKGWSDEYAKAAQVP